MNIKICLTIMLVILSVENKGNDSLSKSTLSNQKNGLKIENTCSNDTISLNNLIQLFVDNCNSGNLKNIINSGTDNLTKLYKIDEENHLIFSSMGYRDELISIYKNNEDFKQSNFNKIKQSILNQTTNKNICYKYLNIFHEQLVTEYFNMFNIYKEINFFKQIFLLFKAYQDNNGKIKTIKSLKEKKLEGLMLEEKFDKYVPFLFESIFYIFKNYKFDESNKLDEVLKKSNLDKNRFLHDFFYHLINLESYYNIIDVDNTNYLKQLFQIYSLIKVEVPRNISENLNFMKAVFNNINILNDFNTVKIDFIDLFIDVNAEHNVDLNEVSFNTIKSIFDNLNSKKNNNELLDEKDYEKLSKNIVMINDKYTDISNYFLFEEIEYNNKKISVHLDKGFDKTDFEGLENKYYQLILKVDTIDNLMKLGLFSELIIYLNDYKKDGESSDKYETIKSMKDINNYSDVFNKFVIRDSIFEKDEHYYNIVSLIHKLIKDSEPKSKIMHNNILKRVALIDNFFSNIIDNYNQYSKNLEEDNLKDSYLNMLFIYHLDYASKLESKKYTNEMDTREAGPLLLSLEKPYLKNDFCSHEKDFFNKFSQITLQNSDIKNNLNEFISKKEFKNIYNLFVNKIIEEGVKDCNKEPNNNIEYKLFKNDPNNLDAIKIDESANSDKIIELLSKSKEN